MLDTITAVVDNLVLRLQRLEQLPFNPFSPDCQMFDHFAGDGTIDARWTSTFVLTGTVQIPNTTPTIARLASGATAGSMAQLDWGTNFSLVGLNKGMDCRTRFAVTTAIDNDDEIGVRLRSATPDNIDFGVIGSLSTAFYVARNTSGGGGTTASTVTTVPIDTAMHDFRVQTFPDRIRYFIDNNQVAEHTTALDTQPIRPSLRCFNGANAGSRTMDVDLFWIRESRS